MEIVLLGHKGRDEATADRLKGHRMHVIGEWPNPGLVDKAESSGGKSYTLDKVTNVEAIADIVQDIQPDMFFTNFDEALAEGVVDTIRKRVADGRMRDLLIPCPNKEASKVEWDKFYLREIIDEIDPKYNPINFMATTPKEVHEAVAYFEDLGIEIAVKPRNLTGGTGVKVMGKHFDTFDEGKAYALKVLVLMGQVLTKLKERGHDYKGVLYPTFFKTTEGLKIVEINARGGDPEFINTLDLMEDDVDFAEVLRLISLGELADDSVRYKKLASAMLYLVSPEYGYKKGPTYEFIMNPELLTKYNCRVRFSSAVRTGQNTYQTVGSSRAVGISSLGPEPWDARDNILEAIDKFFRKPLPLEFRKQVAEKAYISSLAA
jgi:phosphoribosylamine-glycine ligase